MRNANVRSLVDARHQIQLARIAFGNREGAIKRGSDTRPVVAGASLDLAEKYAKIFDDVEATLTADMTDEAQKERIVQDMIQVNGISYVTAAQLVGLIDIAESPTISSLWRHAGYGVGEDGKIDRLRTGKKSVFNKRLKAFMHVVAENLMRCRSGSPYKAIYDKAKQQYVTRVYAPDTPPTKEGKVRAGKPWLKGHVHLAAMRKVKKLFLAHLWKHWRTLEGLPVRDPYVDEYKGHTHIIEPVDFGWPEIKKVNTNPQENS